MLLNAFCLLRYFRINDPYRLFGLLALFLLIQLPLFIHSPDITYPELKSILVGEKVHEGNALYLELIDSVPPLAAWTDGFFEVLFGRSLLARRILAFLLVFLQASYLGIVFANKKAFAENTYIPSLIFIILFAFSFDTLALTPELIGSGFLLPALNNLFKEIEFREQRNESIFNLGLYISLASLFSFSYSLFLIGVLFTLIIFTRSSARKYLLLIFGFVLPHLLLASGYYLMDGLAQLWQYYYIPNLSVHATRYMPTSGLWLLGALPLAYLAISFVMMTREARLSKYQTQLVQSMFFWVFFSFLQVLYSKDLRPQNFVTVIPGITFFITHFLLLIRRKKFPEIHLWILLVGIVTISYLARYQQISNVDYHRLFVPDPESTFADQRILVLDNEWNTYKTHHLATPFLDWNLASEIFAHPDYYENILIVSGGIEDDPPDIIRDKNGLLKPFLDRIPELQKKYIKKGGYYIRIGAEVSN